VSTLPPVDPERNRELIAERLDWPKTALTECIDVENEHPGWIVYWSNGGLPSVRRGFHAFRGGHNPFGRPTAYGATAAELRDAIVVAAAEAATRGPWYP
jgi:hypothetical protein